MRVITEKAVRDYIEEIGEGGIVYGASLVNLLQEIDTEKWQTIEEFNKKPIDGWCWVATRSGFGGMAYHRTGEFLINDESERERWCFVTHVIPLSQPKYPKA